jgi:ABC-type Zn uptake system ZnuABC Zn-binding protein ZnuA
MSAKTKLKNALSAIDDAATALRRARSDANPEVEHQIRKALSELDDAERDIKRAIREIPSV